MCDEEMSKPALNVILGGNEVNNCISKMENQSETGVKIKEEPVSDNDDDDTEQSPHLQPISEVYLPEYQDVNIKTEVEDPIDSTCTYKTESSNNEEEIEIKSEITAEEVNWASLDANEKNCVDSESLVLAHENNTKNQVQDVRFENKPAANVSLFRCHICFQIFSDDSMLKHHLIVCHNLIRIDKNSKDCPQQLNTPLKIPKKVFSLKKLKKCDICNKTFPTNRSLDKHKLVHSEPQLQCPHCDKKLRESLGLKRHIYKVHSGEVHKCDQCDKEFKTKYILRDHKEKVHSPFNGYPWICDECGKGYKVKLYLNTHKKRVHCEAKYSCVVCFKKFKQKQELEKHMKKHDIGSVCN